MHETVKEDKLICHSMFVGGWWGKGVTYSTLAGNCATSLEFYIPNSQMHFDSETSPIHSTGDGGGGGGGGGGGQPGALQSSRQRSMSKTVVLINHSACCSKNSNCWPESLPQCY